MAGAWLMKVNYNSDEIMSENEANEVLFPNIRKMSIEEGFEVYKKFLNRPIECSGTLNVEGYPPRHLHGFRVWVSDEATGEPRELNDDILMELYMQKLTGEAKGEHL